MLPISLAGRSKQLTLEVIPTPLSLSFTFYLILFAVAQCVAHLYFITTTLGTEDAPRTRLLTLGKVTRKSSPEPWLLLEMLLELV